MFAFIVVALVFLLGIAIWCAGVALGAWILMLLLGWLASLTGWACAIGFLPSFVICLIISLFLPRGN